MADWLRFSTMLLGLILLKFCLSLPFMGSLADMLERSLEEKADLDFKFRRRYFEWTSIPSIATALSDRRGREAFPGGKAPNVCLKFVDRSSVYLNTFLRPFRPLVVNFISSVEDPYWTHLKRFNDMAKRTSWMADYLTVVVGCGVMRSRPEWTNLLCTDPQCDCMRHHFCMQDRKTVATFLVEAGIVGDLTYDTPSNEALRKYSPTPERLYVIYCDTVMYDSGRGGDHDGYHMDDVLQFLWKLYYLRVRRDSERYDAQNIACKAPSYFSLDDPRNPMNIVKPARKESRKDSVSAWSRESGLSLDVANTMEQMSGVSGPSILKPSRSSEESISSEEEAVPHELFLRKGKLTDDAMHMRLDGDTQEGRRSLQD